MPTNLIRVAGHFFNAPLFIHQGKADVLLWAFQERIGIGGMIAAPDPNAVDHDGVSTSRFVGSRRKSDGSKGLTRVSDGIALVTVEGSLVNRGAWLDSYSGATSYEGIEAQIKAAVADPSVKGIVLDIDSPGGEATGMMGLAAAVRDARKIKPVIAVVNDMAASAAYGIASAADEIVISPTSIVGSIGVVYVHMDRSGELAQKGVKPTLFFEGDHKVDGHPFGPISATASAELQRDIRTFYDLFLATVEAGRGARLTKDAARNTQAKTFIGEDAVRLGLADRIGTLDQVLAEFSTKPTSRKHGNGNKGALKMSGNNDEPTITKTEHEAAISASFERGKADGVKEGEASATARLDAIMGCDEATGRSAAAMAAFKAGLSLDQAKAVLGASGTGSAPQSVASRAIDPLAALSGAADTSKPDASALWGKAVSTVNTRFGAK